MTTALAKIDVELRAKYAAEDVEKELAEIKAACAGLDPAAGPEAYESSRVAIGKLRTSRTAIEKRRVELKAESLEEGRRIDLTAKVLTSMIEEIEEPLRAKKKAVDDAEARAKFQRENAERLAKEAAEREAREAAEAKERAARAAEDAKRKSELEAQQAALAEERRLAGIENDRILAEQAMKEASIRKEAAKLKAESDRVHAERAVLEAKYAAAVKAEADRNAAIEAEKRAAAEKERLDALRPDREKLEHLAERITALAATAESTMEMATNEGFEACDRAMGALRSAARELLEFGKRAT